MSLSASKSNIYNKIKLYTSIANSNVENINIENILSENDGPLEFLENLTKTLVGQNGLEMLTQVALYKVVSQQYLNTLSDKIYDYVGNFISSDLQYNGTTINLPLSSIDPTNVFKKPDPVLGTGIVAQTTPAQQPVQPAPPPVQPASTTPQVLKKVTFSRSEPLLNPDLDLVHGALGSSKLPVDFEQSVSDELNDQFNNGKIPDVTNIQVKTYIQGNQIITEASCDIIESSDGIAYTVFTTRGSIGIHPPNPNDQSNYVTRHDNQLNYANGNPSNPNIFITQRLQNQYNGVAKQVGSPFTITLDVNGQIYGYKQSFFKASEYSKTQTLVNQQTGQPTQPTQPAQPTNQITNQVNQFSKTLKNQVLSNANTSFSFNLGTTNKTISLTYNEIENVIKTEIPNMSVLELFTGLRVLIGPMFSANVLVNEILNILFHTEWSKEDAEVLTIVRSYTNYTTKDVFKMDLKKLLDTEIETSEKGYNLNVNCFRENITITKGQIDKIVTNPTIENFKTLIPEFKTSTTTENKNAEEDYFKRILKTIGEAILSIIIKQPIIMFFINLYHKILDFSLDLKTINIGELIDKFKKFFENLFDVIYEEIICVIFNWIKKYLIKLVVGVTIILLKEQLNKKINILKSLGGFKRKII
jgi:hypothetical protein